MTDTERTFPAVTADGRRDTLLEGFLFVAILAYALLMFFNIPSGRAGIFPNIVIPLLLALLALKIAFVLFGTHVDSVVERLNLGSLDVSLFDVESTEASLPSESAPESTRGWKGQLLIVALVMLGVVLTYLLGAVGGGAPFVFAFVYIFSRNLTASVVVTVLTSIVVYGMSTVLGLRLWAGVLG